MKSLIGKKIRCPCCNSEMLLYDVDYNFKGNQNEYWKCNNYECNTQTYIQIRYSKICHRPIKYYDSEGIELTENDIIYKENLL